jgi:hypothetical protein
MGLTIHYTVTHQGPIGDLVEKLKGIRTACLDLPFQEVGDDVRVVSVTPDHIAVWQWLQQVTFYPNNSRENLAMRDRIMALLGVDSWRMIQIETYHRSMSPAGDPADGHAQGDRLRRRGSRRRPLLGNPRRRRPGQAHQ